MKAFEYAARAALFLITVCIAIFLCGLAGMAQAQVAQCGGYADVLADLSQAYHEQVVWVGERGNAGQMVITAKPDGSTWTAMVVQEGIACLVAAGTGWKATASGDEV